jgi:hypothetical protein
VTIGIEGAGEFAVAAGDDPLSVAVSDLTSDGYISVAEVVPLCPRSLPGLRCSVAQD